jgi:hypothetical protein
VLGGVGLRVSQLAGLLLALVVERGDGLERVAAKRLAFGHEPAVLGRQLLAQALEVGERSALALDDIKARLMLVVALSHARTGPHPRHIREPLRAFS